MKKAYIAPHIQSYSFYAEEDMLLQTSNVDKFNVVKDEDEEQYSQQKKNIASPWDNIEN